MQEAVESALSDIIDIVKDAESHRHVVDKTPLEKCPYCRGYDILTTRIDGDGTDGVYVSYKCMRCERSWEHGFKHTNTVIYDDCND